ncbi:MAG: Ig-like domain-containing protein, partial [Chitinophagaceae bacterium]
MNLFKIIPVLLIVSILSCKKSDNPGENPTVKSTNPDKNVTGVSRSSDITFTFSESMNPS